MARVRNGMLYGMVIKYGKPLLLRCCDTWRPRTPGLLAETSVSSGTRALKRERGANREGLFFILPKL